MQTACQEATKSQEIAPYPVQVAVNVSSAQFRREFFVSEVVDILKSTGLKPELLQLELTESIMLSGVHHTAATMNQLKAMGVSLAIDDFGTGYSCLGYLPALPFDVLKVDRCFVSDIETRPGSRAMVHSLLGLAENIGMRVVVEGIERDEQLEVVRQIGGSEVQGFLLGRPIPDPAAHVEELVQSAGRERASGQAAGRT